MTLFPQVCSDITKSTREKIKGVESNIGTFVKTSEYLSPQLLDLNFSARNIVVIYNNPVSSYFYDLSSFSEPKSTHKGMKALLQNKIQSIIFNILLFNK